MPEKVIVIGGGFAGLSAACSLAKKGYKVTLVDRHDQIGGRARVFEEKGFKFDYGPSWYWMPDVFDTFFANFGKKVSDYYSLQRLDPPYRVFFKEEIGHVDVPDKAEDLGKFFESREKGAGEQLKKFLKQAKYKYEVGMADYVRRPSVSIMEFLDGLWLLYESVCRLDMFTTHRAHVQKFFKDPINRELLEWPVLFLGGAPDGVPALYSLMDHASVVLGTFYPEGGMHAIPAAMANLAEELGVDIQLNVEVEKIVVGSNGLATGVKVKRGKKGSSATSTILDADIVVGTGDMNWIEQQLLEPQYRRYTEQYWDKRVMSPGSLLYYIGVSKKLPNLKHHNLFFDESLDDHCVEIYDDPAWPEKPLFYACVPSKTDASTAPEGQENLFLLVPLAAGLEDTDEEREKCYNLVMDRLEKRIGEDVRGSVVYKRAWAHREFEDEYHSYKGNAYGLANTLLQTAFFKPSMKSVVPNVHFAGQLTSPGPGVPPAIISGQITADVVDNCSYLRVNGKKTIPMFLYGLFAAIADIFAMTSIEMVSGLDFFSALKFTVSHFLFVLFAFVVYVRQLAGFTKKTD